MNKTRYDLAVEAGLEKGLEKGLVLGLQAAVRELLEAKAGPLPGEVVEKVNATTDPAELRKWLIAAGTVNSLAAFRDATGL